MDGYIWISVAVALLALVSFGLTWNSLMHRAMIIARLQGLEIDRRDAWENLDFSTKLKFFNFWVVVQILGNLCQFFGAILAFVELDAYIETQETLTGFGCFFAWVNVVGYLPHNSVSYTIINTLKRGLPVIIPYVVGILPIFMAYAFLGVALFWPTSYFPNPMMSMVVLFALINGDTVYVFSSAMADTYYFLGQLYFFTFLVFFIWCGSGSCVHNVLLALVNEGFQSLNYAPVRRGDDSDEEDDIDFRSEMYKNRPNVPMLRVSDSAVHNERKRLKAQIALKHILYQGAEEERKENTVRLRTEMNWVVTQLEDLLYDLKAVLERDPDEDVDKAQLRAAVLTFLESDLPALILSM